MKHKNIPEYTGKIIVDLSKARPFSEVPNGREILGKLTKIKIKCAPNDSKNLKNNSTLFSERDLAVPVCITNKDVTAVDRSEDWTNISSPITEIGCCPVVRWWPRAIFRGSQKIGDIAEEIRLDCQTYTVRLETFYAFTQDIKEALFSDINGDKSDLALEPITDTETTEEHHKNGNAEYVKNSFYLDDYSLRDDTTYNETPIEKSLISQDKNKIAVSFKRISPVKVIVGSVIIGSIVTAAIFLTVKWFNHSNVKGDDAGNENG
jgi:hypothetical protein